MRRPTLRLRGAVLRACLMLGLAPLSVRAAPPPPCLVAVEVSSPAAVVGQQLVLRVRILSRNGVTEADWIAPERVPGFRVEWLPGQTLPEPQEIEGAHYRVREERRALFPERPGELRIAATPVRCRISGSEGEEEFEVSAPAASVSVREPPAIGRPPGFAALVGPISLQAIATPSEIRLGESVRLAFMLRGSGNVWEVDDLLGPIANAEIFPRRPELRFETGPVLAVVKHFAYDVVPMSAGELVLPAVRVAYFDPASASFATATSEPLRIRVGPRIAAAPAPSRGGSETKAERPDDAGAPQPPAASPAGSPWWIVAAAIIAGLGASFPLLRSRLTRAARGAALTAKLVTLPPGESPATAYAGALRAALGRRVSSVRSLSAEEIAALPDLPGAVADAAALLLAVERARFDPNAPLPSRQTVERALLRL